MKTQKIKINEVDYSEMETTNPMESVAFTEIVKDELRAIPFSEFSDILNFIALEHKLKVEFAFGVAVGTAEDFFKSQEILGKMVMFN